MANNEYAAILSAMTAGSNNGSSGLHNAISELIMKKGYQSQDQQVAGPSHLSQRGSTAIKRSEMVDFEGNVAMRKDVIKVNPVYPLGVVRDLSREIKGGRDLPSTNNVKSYPKNILPSHTLFKIVSLL